MNRQRISAIVRKDVKEFASNRMVMIPMVIVPVLICVLMPAALLTAALASGNTAFLNGAQQIEKLIPAYNVPDVFTTVIQRLMYVFLNYTFIPFFMLVPVMVSSIISANSIVGEKERKTLETLLYTPVTNREFIVAKLLSSFLPALVISWTAFVCFFVVTNGISLLFVGQLIVRSWIWLPALLLTFPAVALLGLSTTLSVSLKAKTFAEAQQIAAVVVLPIIALVLIQITGVVVFNILYLLVFSVILARDSLRHHNADSAALHSRGNHQHPVTMSGERCSFCVGRGKSLSQLFSESPIAPGVYLLFFGGIFMPRQPVRPCFPAESIAKRR